MKNEDETFNILLNKRSFDEVNKLMYKWTRYEKEYIYSEEDANEFLNQYGWTWNEYARACWPDAYND